MSTFAAANLGSDDESDVDFVPAQPKKSSKAKRRRRGSASSGSSGSSEDDSENDQDEEKQTEIKRLKLEAQQAEEEKRKQDAANIFASMMAEDVAKPGPVKAQTDQSTSGVEMVEIERPRQFAGETVYETVLVRRDSPEAAAFLARKNGQVATALTDRPATSDATDAESVVSKPTDVPAPEASGSTAASGSTTAQPSKSTPASSSSTPTPAPKGKPPFRRKPRQSLEAMSAALDKGKKMTTLEKSQMDWKSHTAADPSVQAELEANRRGGGYLEKQQFLERVDERRTGTYESNRR